ncbi:hypothetical protein DVK85_05610 [Flavobacterium arcticum]|uniref:Uncharacterized protein n=1 Tax=Flavobacterium arcticum TaxID=1784713 RepID=A0A345HAX7_9FLAO|nr:hypothetical protein [Flavobacterium arcticum]AXG73737.1 hypothetical protein DVK85_05610 [Flavobacterium arcticum]KAF2511688.1 hypothetical protein E0W72_05120 [Flavobacterium arcticum]
MDYFQLHYYLKDNEHSLDAFVLNKAESELLKIFKEVLVTLNLEGEIAFEAIAIEEGGIKSFYKLLRKKKTKKRINKVLIFLGGILSVVITDIVSNKLNTDTEYEQLQKDEIKLRIQKLKQDLEKEDNSEEDEKVYVRDLYFYITHNDKIKIFKSNFYSALLDDGKVEQISTQLLNKDRIPYEQESIVSRANFDRFIIHTRQIEPIYQESIIIEIVAPVLKKSKMKWKGVYDDKPINFNLRDTEFRNSVLNGEISFSSGISVVCDVELEQSINDEGEVTIEAINVYNVTDVIVGAQTIETKRKKRNKELLNQTKLDL